MTPELARALDALGVIPRPTPQETPKRPADGPLWTPTSKHEEPPF